MRRVGAARGGSVRAGSRPANRCDGVVSLSATPCAGSSLPLRGCLLLAAVLTAAAPVSAYEGDHYAWTYYLALQLGCTERQAYQIASGAYAIDWDPETAPLPGGQDPNTDVSAFGFGQSVGFRVHGWTAGAGDSFDILQGTPPERLQQIWLRYHAFSPSTLAGVGDEVEAFKARRKETLFALARRQKNPGPLIHYLQDYHAHYGWEDVRGHALGGHLPDFLSDDPAKARRMTEDTLRWLSRFLSEGLGQTPKSPDRARIQQVLDRLIEVNRAPAGLPSSARVRNALPSEEELLARFDAGETFLEVIRQTLLAIDPEGGFNWYAFKLTVDNAPEIGASLSVVREAIAEDKRAGRLTGGWRELLEADPEAAIGRELLPSRWIAFDYDDGAVVQHPAYAVERLELEVGEPAVTYAPEGDDGPVEVTVRLPYRVDGGVEIPGLPRPLLAEVSEIADFEPVRSFRDLENGSQVLSKTFRRSRSRLAEGLDWRGTIAIYGAEPEVRQVTLRYGDAPPPEPTDDLEDLVRRLEETAQVASGAAARAREACAAAEDIAADSWSTLSGIAAGLDELRELTAAGAMIGDAGSDGGDVADPLAAARAEAARAQAAAEALAVLRDRAGTLRSSACEAGAGSAGVLATIESAARQRLAELSAAVGSLRRLAASSAPPPAGPQIGGRSRALAAELGGRLDRLEDRLGRARSLLGSVRSDLDLLGVQEREGSSILEEIVRRLPSAPPGADLSDRMDSAYGQLRAAVESAAGCDLDVGAQVDQALASVASLRNDLAGIDLPQDAAFAAAAPAAAGREIESLIAAAESQLAVAELFVESIVNRAQEARDCLDAPDPDPAGDETDPAADSDGDAAIAAEEDAGDGDGWVIEEGVETIDERRTDRPEPRPQGSGADPQPAGDGVSEAIGRAQDAFARCDFASALAWAERVAAQDPGNAWVAANRARIAELAGRQRRTVGELEVARGLIRSGRLDRAREALAAAARVAPGCMSEPIAATNRQVVTAIAERRTANREALASGLTSLIGALGQAAAAVQGSRSSPRPAAPTPGLAIPSSSSPSAAAAAGAGPPDTSGPRCATLDLRSFLEPLARQSAAEQDSDDEKIVWYVEEYSYQGVKIYGVTPAGSRSAERLFATIRQYTAPYGVALSTQGPYGTLQQAWSAAVGRCSYVIRPQG